MKFPYGLADFYSLRKEGYFYQDRTHFIRIIEEWGKQLVFLRPRRFGKSLWLSILANYYDIARSADFTMLFGDPVIGQNPIPLHNRHLILRWDFSKVAVFGDVEEIVQQLTDCGRCLAQGAGGAISGRLLLTRRDAELDQVLAAVRAALINNLAALQEQERAEVLRFLADETLFTPSILDEPTLAAIAGHIVEISKWHWL